MPYADKKQQREYQRNWMRARRAEYFKNKQCAMCGTNKELELDHIDYKSKVSHRIWSYSAAKREAELSKCQILCRVCHDKKTADDLVDMGIQAKHGTYTMYGYGCSCNECNLAMNKYWRDYRARKRQLNNN